MDAVDVDETKFAAVDGNVMGEFQRSKVIPEIDAYRYSTIATLAEDAGKTKDYTPDKETILEELMEDVKTLGLDVSKGSVRDVVTEKLTFLAFAFARNPSNNAAALKLVEFLNYADIFGFEPDTVRAQEFVFVGLRSLGEEARKKDILRALARKLKIAL